MTRPGDTHRAGAVVNDRADNSQPSDAVTCEISVVFPAYNEAPNLDAVVRECLAELERLGRTHEILVVDDGSSDDTRSVMLALCNELPAVRYVRLRRNLGKSGSLDAALSRVNGTIVVLMDADGQDDPSCLGALLAEVDGGTHLVTGRRSVRQDRPVKRYTSRLYNWVTSKVTGVEGSDFNSGFKAMRRDVADALPLYGELHRYIPVIASWYGFTVGEIDVNHRARLAGTSKFGRARFWRGFLDLVTVKFLASYTRRPFHLFGGTGAAASFLGFALLAWMGVEKIFGNSIGGRPALAIGVFLVIVGIQLTLFGLLGELVIYQRVERSAQDWIAEERSSAPVP